MEKKIRIYNKKISYFLKKSSRAKRMRIAVYHDGKIIVIAPKNLLEDKEKQYLISRSKWITAKLSFYNKLRKKDNNNFDEGKFLEYKDKAHILAENTLINLKAKYKYSYNAIQIKNQKTIWGSCSKKNILSFNYKIALLKPQLREYVITHEFCHLKIKNHSRKFWILVENMMPEYRKIKEKVNSLLVTQ